ncbi:DHH family phosphoesterase [Ileibacterium valens]|mgnify:CR=1 FL=1|uniref:DHH family phosphoesterase n=1 Tax=Ileibacterium valens TaxID=1862668 RepID=UPI00259B8B4B|nr:bifunctional oligoribonuclease/PAP phosphatase NrnA [Ileibacterium valens]
MPKSEQLKNFAKKLQSEIEAANTITLFRHVFPDPDALGSQLGLKGFLESNYPDKKIFALGQDGQGKKMDEASDEDVKNSLAIILDSATSPRIDDDRWKTASKTIRIDHHVRVEDYGDLELVDEDATATCELIARILNELQASIPSESAQLLYEGLIADNLRFAVNKTSPDTFLAASYLVRQGIDLAKANANVFAGTYQDFVYENKVRQNAYRKNNALISVMDQHDYLSCGMDFSKAKEKVYALGNIIDIEVWALFTRMEDGIHYSASLRSRRIPIRDIAVEYDGGGHELASGIKNLSAAQVSEIAAELAKRSLTAPEEEVQ